MKWIWTTFLYLMTFFYGCNVAGTDSLNSSGDLLIASTPEGADIYFDNSFSGRATPYYFNSIKAGSYLISLILPGYRDTSFIQEVIPSSTASVHVNLTFISDIPDTVYYRGIKLYQYNNENNTGLDLSTGRILYADSQSVDIFSDVREGPADLRSQHLKNAFLTNRTFFFNSSSEDLNDGEDSGRFDPSDTGWIFHNMNNRNVSFIYDKDGHYSKLKIVRTGDEGPYNRYIIVDYIYNKNPGDPRF